MTKEELLKKIKKLNIKTKAVANEFFVGNYRSIFKGNGMEFSDVRKYEVGDDVKRIDWKTSARQRKTYVKEYEEERELSIFLIVDISLSNNFRNKEDLIAQISGSLAYSGCENGDNVGLILFSDKVEKFIPPQKGRNQTLKIIDSLLNTKPSGRGTDISLALNFLRKIKKTHSIIFLISDFLDNNFEKQLKITAKQHTLIPIRIIDRKFESLPKGFLFTLKDSETGEDIIVGNFKENINFQESLPIKTLDIYTDEDYTKTLMKFFKRGGKL
ncbi:DUF58 domain-containing protein [Fusobacterium sp.]|uniref:DUF58 domain-containing protein n=1 Tax=Fusobacterium sp. TaxID=68766 RepID=UPI00263027CC|nr:DUF58 domain-containing protein [Fusobacterium sp.]